MASLFEAKVFDTEIHFHSLRKLFEESVPTGKVIFDTLKAAFDKDDLPAYEFEKRTIYLESFDISGNWVVLLFHLTDPNVRDRDYSNLKNKTIRTASRQPGEEPAFSSHVVIHVGNEGDLRRSYPCIIEEAENLSRTLIARVINLYVKRYYNEERVRPEQKDKKTFQLSAQLRAPIDQTLEGLLQKGGAIEEIKFIEEGIASVVNGDEAFPVQEERQFRIKPEGRPTKDRARDFITGYWSSFDRRGKKSIRIVIYDAENESQKTIGIDPKQESVLENAFIKKERLTGFKVPLKECDVSVRDDVVAKMKELVHVETN